MKQLNWNKTSLNANYLVVKAEDTPFGVDWETASDILYRHKEWLKKSEEEREDLQLCMKEPHNAIVYDFSTQNLNALWDITPSELLEGHLKGLGVEPTTTTYLNDYNALRIAQQTHAHHVEYHSDTKYWKGNSKDLFIVIVDMTDWIAEQLKEEEKDEE